MFKVALVFAAPLSLAGCAETPSQYEQLSQKPTPKSWTQSGVWQFHLVSPERLWRGSITLELTDRPTDTCTSGSWKLAELVHSSVDLLGNAGPALTVRGPERRVAYLITGANIWIDLNGNICDSNNFLRGELLENGATGRIDHSHMLGSEHLGWFTAAPARE